MIFRLENVLSFISRLTSYCITSNLYEPFGAVGCKEVIFEFTTTIRIAGPTDVMKSEELTGSVARPIVMPFEKVH